MSQSHVSGCYNGVLCTTISSAYTGTDNEASSIAMYIVSTKKEAHIRNVTGFTKTVLIGTRNEIHFIADY